MKGKLLLALVTTCFTFTMMHAQDFTIYNMPYLQQRYALNPSFIPKSNVQVGIPALSSIGISLSNSGFKWSDLFDPSVDSLMLGGTISNLKDENYFITNFRAEILAVGFKVKNNYFNINVSENARTQLTYPKGFFQFLWYGNGANVSEDLNFGFKVDMIHYREYAVGYSREIGDKLTVGARLKYLYGMENINTERSNITLSTNEDSAYALTVATDIEINTSGLGDVDGENQNYVFGKKNTGFGFDLGIGYKLTDKITVNASALNVGTITWRSDVKNYFTSNPNASYTYSGLPMEVLFEGDSALTQTIEQLTDSVTNLFALDSSFTEYKTGLGGQFHLSGNYEIIEGQNVGAHFVLNTYNGVKIPAVSLSYASCVGKWLTATVNYTIYNRSYTNIGLGLRLNGGPFQWHIVTDNLFGALTPQHAKYVNVRTGFNLTFGGGNKKIKMEEE